MNVVITRGRVGKQATLKVLAPKESDNLLLCCPKNEVTAHKNWLKEQGFVATILPVPDKITEGGVSSKREWLLKHANKSGWRSLTVIDDDLQFLHRVRDGATNQVTSSRKEAWAALDLLRYWVDVCGYKSAGLSNRNGNNTNPGLVGHAERQVTVHCYDVEFSEHLLHSGARKSMAEFRVMEDHYYTLCLLLTGHANIVSYQYAVGQSFGAPGGCSIFRTEEVHNAGAHKLKETFPEFVKLRQVHHKTFGGVERTETMIYWKKALAAGRNCRVKDLVFAQPTRTK